MTVLSLSPARGSIVRPALQTALVLLLGGLVAASSVGAAEDAPGSGHVRLVGQHAGLDERVDRLAQALGLNPTQRAGLRRVLVHQREQIVQLWSGTAMPAAYRIAATQAISEQAADQIRALLNDEQKQKYKPPRQPRETLAGSGQASVADWMNAGRAAQPAARRMPQTGDEVSPRSEVASSVRTEIPEETEHEGLGSLGTRP